MNNIDKKIYDTFQKGSKTYFHTSIFFPKTVKKDVFILYSFVRKADNFVDSVPQQTDEYYAFKKLYYNALNGTESGDIIIDSFIDLMKRRNFTHDWIDEFLGAMELDLIKNTYNSMDELLRYMYGSAEVIGLMMSAIMGLDHKAYHFARYLGRAMQYINFIRDIREDIELGRRYLPLGKTSLRSLNKDYILNKNNTFIAFIRMQIDQYMEWQLEAEKGFFYIPKRFLIPVKTASDMYKWTAGEIKKNPMIIYERKVKPSRVKIILTILKNSVIA
jgi:phytoene synthase